VDFHVSLVGRKDLTGEIYRRLRRAVLDGWLALGDACGAVASAVSEPQGAAD
jgi:hypothetical protein